VEGCRVAQPVAAEIEKQDQVLLAQGCAGEAGGFQRIRGDGDAELLLELAGERILGHLAFLHLPARKFPQARHGAAGRPLLEQDPPLGIGKRRRHHRDRRFF